MAGHPGRRAAAALCGLSLWLAVAPATAQDLLVFAAASLQDALDAVIEDHQAQGGGEVRASYAASSALARQIEAGAPADIFISASPDWMDYVEERDLIREGSRSDLLGNGLVLVAPLDSDITVEVGPGFDLLGALDGGHLAMGDPDHVPAGVYGRAALESLGVWEAVEPQVARADNVRAALALVSRGEAPLGVVYSSDAAADDTVKVVGDFPPGSFPEIVYPIAMVADSQHAQAAGLVEALHAEAAAAIFERHGFIVLK